MNSVAPALGILSAAAWTALSAVTLAGTWFDPVFMPVNLGVAALFCGVAAFLAWRVRVLAAVGRAHRDCPAVRRLFLLETISNALMLALGGVLLSGAAYRVLSEGKAVFG